MDSKKIYQLFDPEPLTPEQSHLYTELDEARGSAGFVSKLAKRIGHSESLTCQLVTGHRGCGKSTELLRLKKRLEEPPDKIFTVYCDVDKDIDRNDVDFPEILISVVRRMAEDLQKREKINLQPGYFKDRYERLISILSKEVEFQGLKLDPSMLIPGLKEISATLKSSPDVRETIRKILNPDTTNWIKAANELIGDAKLQLVKKGYSNLCLLVDDLDKILVHSAENKQDKRSIFIEREAQFKGFQCHVVYSMPIALAYSTQERDIANLYGGNPLVVPMVKISSPPPKSNQPYPPGLQKIRAIVEKRLKSAGVRENEVFAPGTLDQLARLSGGQPRELMIFIREAIITTDLPIDERAVVRVIREFRMAYDRQLTNAHWPVIEEVRKTGRFERVPERENAIRELLDSRAILQYSNEEQDEWYNLNPVVAQLKKPAVKAPAPSKKKRGQKRAAATKKSRSKR